MTTTGDETIVQTIAALKAPIQQWVRGWLHTERTAARAAELGLPGGGDQFWIVGRAGVLGDADASVAAGGLAFLGPERVRAAWDSLPPQLTHRGVAAEYAALCAEWGEAELPRFGDERLSRLDALGRRICDAADASLGLVFTGWRAIEPPATPAGRAALTMHVVRELRGAAHVVAVHASGLTPVQAMLASPAPAPRTGSAWAERMGWSGPFDDPDGLRDARARAEDLTNRVLVPAFGALDAAELADFAELTISIRSAIAM